MNTNTNTTATTTNLFSLIKEKKTKWGISLDRNDKSLSNSGFAFAPFEETTKTTLSLFIAATALKGKNGEYAEIDNRKKMNAIRACYFACKVAKHYNGRTTDKIATVLELDSVKSAIAKTDEMEVLYSISRAAYTTAKRQYEAKVEILGMAGNAQSATDENALNALAALRSDMETKRAAFNNAKKNEDKLNWEIIREYFPWFVNNK